jgi:hypothetical protein
MEGNLIFWTQMNADYQDFKYFEEISAGICENLPAVWQAGLRTN